MNGPAMEFEVKADAVVVAPQTAMTPVELLRIAVSQNADIDKLTKLMDLQERWEKNEARKAFDAAMTRFKSDPPSISKNKHVRYATKAGGMVDYRHATLDHVCNEVIPSLSAVGITHTWKIDQVQDLITVTCILKGFGHSEETRMIGVPDNSGDKTPLKAASSTVTHLQRYTLLAACGLAAGVDDETEHRAGPQIEASVIEKNCSEMSRAKDIPELRFLYGVAYSKAEEISDRKAMQFYIDAKDKRRKELEHAPR